jgi:hypothetical protein
VDVRFAHSNERLGAEPQVLLATRGFLHSITQTNIGVLALHFPIDLHDLLVPGAGTLSDAALLVCCLAGLASVLTGSLAGVLCHLF